MITKKKSSLLKTHKKIKNPNSNNSSSNSSNSSNNISHNSKTIQYKIKKYNDYYNNNIDYDSENSIISINSNFSKTKKNRKKYKTFLSKVRTLRKMKRKIPIGEDKLSIYIDDHKKKLKSGKIIPINNLNKIFFNHTLDKCICENIYDKKSTINKKCNCNNMKLHKLEGSNTKSLYSLYSINCSNKQNILKILPLNENYMKMINKTNKYLYIEINKITLSTIINTYVNNVLPNNSINIINSGICIKKDYKNHKNHTTTNININPLKKEKYGYNLISHANLGNGSVFINKLLNGDYDKDFGIINESIRYEAIVNFLLQTIFLIGHLHSSNLELFHGDYKPENLLIKKCNKSIVKYYKFNVYGHKITVKNIGFSVLISGFEFSSITINSAFNSKTQNTFDNNNNNNYDDNNTNNDISKYRLVPPIVSPFFLSKYVNNLINKFADIEKELENPKRKYDNHYYTDNNDNDNYTNNDNNNNNDNDNDNNYNDNNDINYIKIKKLFMSKDTLFNNYPTIHILRSAGVKLYRDFDIYLFMVKLLDDTNIRKYIISKKIDKTILSFMSQKFKTNMLNRLSKTKTINETAYTIVDIFEKINEPMYKIFTEDYFNTLKNINYKLFKI